MDDDITEPLVYSGSESDDESHNISTFQTTQHSEASSQFSNTPATTTNAEIDSDDDGELNVSVRVNKKRNAIMSSDEEDDEETTNKSEINESRAEGSDASNMSVEDEKDENSGRIIRPSICDSDTTDNGNSEAEPVIPKKTEKKQKKMKKMKKKEKTEKKKRVSDSDRSGSNAGSDSDSDSDNNKSKKKHKKSSLSRSSGEGSSGSETSASNNEDEVIKPREKVQQRMSAKVAEEQMREIQSESQRMARESYISVPYHKPKQRSLQEFLSRRSIMEHGEQLKSKPLLKTAAAIKMSGQDLIDYANKINQRIQESEEFFQEEEEEDENSDDGHNGGTANEDNPQENIGASGNKEQGDQESVEKVPDNAGSVETDLTNEAAAAIDLAMDTDLDDIPLDEISAPENTKTASTTNIASNAVDDGASTSHAHDMDILPETELDENPSKQNIIELHTERNDLDDELDQMDAPVVQTSNRKRNIAAFAPLCAPKLGVGKGMIIDLETNVIMPQPKSGVDLLVERFVQNAIVRPSHGQEEQEISIFQTETGSLEKRKIHLTTDDKNIRKDPKPGEAYFKLKSELSRKIEERRRETIAKRRKEEEEARKEEEGEEEEEEDDGDEYELGSSGDETDSKKPRTKIDAETEELVLDEADEEEDDENKADDEEVESNNEANEEGEDQDDEENESNDSDDDSSGNDSEKETNGDIEAAQPRRRIIAMNDDSDDENAEKMIENAKEGANSNQETNIEPLYDDEPEDSNEDSDKPIISTELPGGVLFDDSTDAYGDIGESQLMAMCSGSFATQKPQNDERAKEVDKVIELDRVVEPPQTIDAVEPIAAKPDFSSDEEDVVGDTEKAEKKLVRKKKKKGKKKKAKQMVYSDDEEESGADDCEDDGEEEDGEEEEEEGVEDEETEDYERYVEYDSDENEVEVKLTKKDVKMKAANYFENEAELSGSEASEDEDEKGQNHYEAELGDLDHFDNDKIRSELERMALREQTDQDARQLRILQEVFIEEEDNGSGRERKFRWKHLDNADLDDHLVNDDEENADGNGSDDENEEEWRRLRYEREQLLKQQNSAKITTSDVSALDITTGEQVNDSSKTTIMSSTIRRISIAKPSVATPKTSSPFLINQIDMKSSHLSRKSFLNRDSPLLDKIASSSKASGDGENYSNTTKGKGNYVFTVTKKVPSTKRKSDADDVNLIEASNPTKKPKLSAGKTPTLRPQTELFLDSLN